MRDANGHSSSLHAPTTNQALSGHNVSFTVDPSTDTEGTDPCPPHEHDPWSCMETIQLATDTSPPNAHDPDRWSCMENIQFPTGPCPPNAHDPDPWSCMENIQLPTEPSASDADDPDTWCCMETIQLQTDPCRPHDCDPWSCMDTMQLEQQEPPSSLAYSSDPGNECRIPDHTNWINWIDRNKYLLRQCMTQPWFLQLKVDWKQYLREHMVANEDNVVSGQRALRERGNIPSVDIKKDAWKKWVEQQHQQMSMYGPEQQWFQHLLHNVQEETVPAKGEVPRVAKHLEVENVNAAQQMLRVRVAPRSQLHPQSYMKKRVTAKIWILLLALIIEQCEVDRRLQDRELYVDDLLQKLCHSDDVRGM
ncbi:hypothetical protein AK88_05671 [Plasmodium fragile]|uniref:Schizont-infected cell agglutination C-terminal domain-containing protein n=1 Tax=Plasmodium fragile TaxID=5857 RepID=A0A0D9QD00_PLAFR|nr:uncharacterized protein AK88_05671 [Plasmodium fragile]KJP84697.1 hypothetical protein AK88_05671 [Plasmodium fragile]